MGICGEDTDRPCPDPGAADADSRVRATSTTTVSFVLPDGVDASERSSHSRRQEVDAQQYSPRSWPLFRTRRSTVRWATRWRSSARRPGEDLPVLLKGPTGCGKTRFVEAMAHELGRELITVAGHEDMTSADLVGRFLLKGGETVWVDGPLTRAVREGAIFYPGRGGGGAPGHHRGHPSARRSPP